MPPLPAKGWSRDTTSFFLVDETGHVQAQYFCNEGSCDGKVTYQYKDGHLTRVSRYGSPDRHPLFSAHAAYNHPLISEDIWTYKAGKVFSTLHTAGPLRTPTREVRYAYDREGRVTAEYNTYPRQSLVYYPTHYDAVVYEYNDDSVYKEQYENGILRDSLAYVARYNKSGQLTEQWQISKDGKHYERELRRYDSSGRITEFQYLSDRPAVKPDGTVLRADRVEYTYDALGRPDEVRYFARGIKRWSYKYDYLK